MNPKLWGPHLWYILHLFSFTYPDDPSYADKRAYHDFFTNLRYLLPCSFCRKHFSRYLAEYPITPHLDRRVDLIKWVIQIHNFVNLSIGKPEIPANSIIQYYQANGYRFPGEVPKEFLPITTLTGTNKSWWVLFSLVLLAVSTIVYLKWLDYYDFEKY